MHSPARENEAAKPSVHVAIRVSGSGDRDPTVAVTTGRPRLVTFTPPPGHGPPTNFTADTAYAPSDTNKAVYASSVRPLVASVLQGSSGMVAVHGRSGTRRLALLTGDPADLDGPNKSIALRALQDIFYFLRKRSAASAAAAAGSSPSRLDATGAADDSGSVGFAIHASILRVTPNEDIIDMMRPASGALRLVEAPSGDTMEIEGLSLRPLSNPKEILPLLARFAKRVPGESIDDRNASSLALIITVAQSITSRARATRFVTVSKLGFVLLPGAEVASATVNRALNAFRAVATLLRSHATLDPTAELVVRSIPYAYSKLTSALKDMLTPTSHVVLIATVSDASKDAHHTLATLEYASRIPAPLFGSDPDIADLLGHLPSAASASFDPYASSFASPFAASPAPAAAAAASSSSGPTAASLASALEAASADNATLTALLAASQDKVTAAVDDAAYAQAEARDALARLRDERTRSADLAAAQKVALDDLSATKSQLAKANNALELARAEAAASRSDADKHRSLALAARTEADDLARANSSLTHQLGEAVAELEATTASNVRLEERTQALNSQINTLRSSLDNALSQLESSRAHEISLETQLAEAHREASSSHDALTSALTELDLLTNQYNEAVARMGSAKASAKSAALESATLRSQLEASQMTSSLAAQYRDRAASADDLREELARLHAKLNKQVTYMRSVEDEKDKAEHVIIQLRSQLDKAERKLQRVAIRVESEVEDQVSVMRKKLLDAESEIDRLTRKVRDEEERAHRAQTMHATDPILDRQLAQLKMELQAETSRREQLETELRDSRKSLQELHTQHDILTHDQASMARKLDHRQDTLTRLNQDKAKLTQDLDATTKSLATVTRDRDAVTAELAANDHKLTALSAELDAAQGLLKDRAAAIKRLEADLSSHAAQALAADKKHMQLAMGQEQADATIDRLKTDLVAARAAVQDTQAELRDAIKGRDEQAVQLSAANARIASQKDQAARDAAASSELSARLEAAIAAHEDTKAELRDLRHDLASASTENTSLARELVTVQAKLEKATESADGRAAAAAAARDEARDLKSDLDAKDAQLGKVAAQLDATRESLDATRKSLAETSATAKEKATLAEELHGKVLQLENQAVLLQDRAAHGSDLVASLKADLAAAVAATTDMTRLRDAAAAETRSAALRISELEMAAARDSRALEDATKTNSELESRLRDARESLAETQAALSRTSSQLSHTSADLERAQNRITNLESVETQARALEANLAQLSSELGAVKDSAARSASVAAEWERKTQTSQADAATLRDQLRDAQYELRNATTTNDSLTSELARVNALLADATSTLKFKTDALAQAERDARDAARDAAAEVADLNRAVAQARSDTDHSASVVSRTEALLREANDALAGSKVKIAALEETIQSAKVRELELNSAVNAGLAKVHSLEQDLARQAAQAQESAAAAKAAAAEADRVLAERAREAADALASRDATIESLNKTRANMQAEVAQLKAELDSSRQEILREQNARSSVQDEMRELRAALTAANNSTAQARDALSQAHMSAKEDAFRAQQAASLKEADLRGMVAEAQRATQAVQAELDRVSRVAAEVPDLRSTLQSRADAARALETELASTKTKLAELESRARAHDSMANSLEPLKAAVADGLAANAELSSKVASLSAALETEKDNAAAAAANLAKATAEAAAASERAAVAGALVDTERARTDSLRSDLDRAAQDLIAAQAKCSDLEHALQLAQSKVVSAEQQVAFANERVNTLRDSKAELESKLKNSEARRSELDASLVDARTDLVRAESQIAVLDSAKASAQAQAQAHAESLDAAREDARNAQSQLDALQKANDSLKSLCEQLEASVSDARASAQTARDELASAVKLADTARANELAAKESAAAIKLELATQGAHAQLAMYESQARAQSSKAADNEEALRRLTELDSRNRRLTDALQRAEDDAADAQAQVQSLLEQIKRLRSQIVDREDALDRASEAERAANVRADRAEQEVEVKARIIANLREELDVTQELHTRTRDLELQLNSLSEVLAEAQARAQTEALKEKRTRRSLEEALEARDTLQQDVANLQSQLAAKAHAISSLEVDRSRLVSQLTEVSLNSSALDASLEQQVERADRTQASLRDQIASTRSDLAETQDKLAAAQAELEAARSRAISLSTELESAQNRASRAEDELAILRADLRAAHTDLDHAKANASRSASDLVAQGARYESLVAELRAEIERLQDRTANLQMSLLERETELATSIAISREMEDELAVERLQHSHIRSQIEAAVSSIE